MEEDGYIIRAGGLEGCNYGDTRGFESINYGTRINGGRAGGREGSPGV